MAAPILRWQGPFPGGRGPFLGDRACSWVAAPLHLGTDCYPSRFLDGNLPQFPSRISSGCRHRLPQIWWLKTTEMYSHRVLEVRRPHQGVHRATLPWEALGENSSLPVATSGGCWHSLAGGRIALTSFSVLQHSSLCFHPHVTLSPVCLISLFLSLARMLASAHQGNPG